MYVCMYVCMLKVGSFKITATSLNKRFKKQNNSCASLSANYDLLYILLHNVGCWNKMKSLYRLHASFVIIDLLHKKYAVIPLMF